MILRKDANANVVLNQLYKHTQLQDTFGVIMLCLFQLMEVLSQRFSISRYAEILSGSSGGCCNKKNPIYDLNKAQERAHILEGLLKALDNIDEVIRIIRGSRSVQIARQELN